MPLRVLFLSDTHLGLDLPSRPRVERRRRGDDLFESFERALVPALSGEAGVVVHGGDLFFRSRIPAWLAERVFSRLAELADLGLDVFWVPGNHERSGVPRGLLLTHPRIRVFDRPKTFVVRREGFVLAISGMPFVPEVRRDFPALLAETGHDAVAADAKLLCIHQAVEGAKVGPVGFTFRDGADVLRGRDVPAGFAAVLSGHMHRSQVLLRDLAGRPLASPVLFAGSTDRTSFAEKSERKGTFLLELDRNGTLGGSAKWEFRELPVRPMVDLELDPAGDAAELAARLRDALARLDPHALVRIRLSREPSVAVAPLLGAEALRLAAPPSMTVSVAWRRAIGTPGHEGPEKGEPDGTRHG